MENLPQGRERNYRKTVKKVTSRVALRALVAWRCHMIEDLL